MQENKQQKIQNKGNLSILYIIINEKKNVKVKSARKKKSHKNNSVYYKARGN